MCEGDLLHGRANGARLSVDGAARLRRGPHHRQPHPQSPHPQNVCGSGGARDRRGFCLVARGHRGPASGVAVLSDTGSVAPEVGRGVPRGPWRYDLERGFRGGRLDPHQWYRGCATRHQPYRSARQGHLAAARHSPPHRPRAARNSQRAQKPRLQDRSCCSGSRGPAENRDFRAAMGCPPRARAAYESIANAPTAPRNISPLWAGAQAEMSGAAAVVQNRAGPGESKWWGNYDANIMDTQAPQMSSSTSGEPKTATIFKARSSDARNHLELLDRLFPRKMMVGAPNQLQGFAELFPALAQALVQTPA